MQFKAGDARLTYAIAFEDALAAASSERDFEPRSSDDLYLLSVMVVGDAMGRPLAEALATPGVAYDTSSMIVVGSGGAILSPAVKNQLREHLPNAMVMDSFGASETGAGGSVYDTQGPAAGPRFTMGPFMTVLDNDLRPVEPGSGVTGRLARSDHIPLGYFKDEERTAATFFADAVVVGAPDDRFGERVAAIVQPRPLAARTLEPDYRWAKRTATDHRGN